MNSKNIDKKIQEKANKWLEGNYDENTKSRISEMMANEPEELIESFYRDLEFGTGGLRGIMGVGSNRMNKYTVGMATQGLANYLKKMFVGLEQIKVAIACDSRNNSPEFAKITAEVFFCQRFLCLSFRFHASNARALICYPPIGMPKWGGGHCFAQPKRIQWLQSLLGRWCPIDQSARQKCDRRSAENHQY
jgi:phosphoglucomutase/phosphomannomutase-like protein